MIELYIYGCGGMGRELVPHLTNSSKYKLLGFIDDNPTIKECMGYPCRTLKETLTVAEPNKINTLISIGEPVTREIISKKLDDNGVKQITIDCSAHYDPKYANIGEGCLLHAGSYISVNTKIGTSCMINQNAIVGHDSTIGDYTVLCPSVTLAGNVSIGKRSFVGTRACVKNGVKIGNNVIVGIGAVVISDIKDNVVVAGNPARIIRDNNDGVVFRKKPGQPVHV